MHTTPAASTDLNVIYGTLAEFTRAAVAHANLTDCSAKTVNGTVANVGVTELAFISLGFASASSGAGVARASPSFVLNDVADGPQDLVATRIDADDVLANKVIIRRAQNIAAGGSLALLDFGATEGFAPGTANVTVTGLGADLPSCCRCSPASRLALNAFAQHHCRTTPPPAPQPFAAVPRAQLPGDRAAASCSAFAEERTTRTPRALPASTSPRRQPDRRDRAG